MIKPFVYFFFASYHVLCTRKVNKLFIEDAFHPIDFPCNGRTMFMFGKYSKG